MSKTDNKCLLKSEQMHELTAFRYKVQQTSQCYYELQTKGNTKYSSHLYDNYNNNYYSHSCYKQDMVLLQYLIL